MAIIERQLTASAVSSVTPGSVLGGGKPPPQSDIRIDLPES